jgi:hypothetical protein
MSKVYVIYYDNADRILVGEGGTVLRIGRNGYHLPGGTEGARHAVLADAVAVAGAVREVGEEFGDSRRDRVQAATENAANYYSNRTYGASDGNDKVYIIGVWLSDADMAEMVGNVTDGKTDPDDSAFSRVLLVTLDQAVNGFAVTGNSWFIDAIVDCFDYGVDEEPDYDPYLDDCDDFTLYDEDDVGSLV